MAEEIRGRLLTVRKYENTFAGGRLKIGDTVGHIELECKNLMTREEKEDLDEDFVLFYRVEVPSFFINGLSCVFEPLPKYGFIGSNEVKRITVGYSCKNHSTVAKTNVPNVHLEVMKISFRKYGFPSKPTVDHLRKSWMKIYKETPKDRLEFIQVTFGSFGYDCPAVGEINGNSSFLRGGGGNIFQSSDDGKKAQNGGSVPLTKTTNLQNSNEMEEIDRLKGSIDKIHQNIEVIAWALSFLVVTHLVKIIYSLF